MIQPPCTLQCQPKGEGSSNVVRTCTQPFCLYLWFAIVSVHCITYVYQAIGSCTGSIYSWSKMSAECEVQAGTSRRKNVNIHLLYIFQNCWDIRNNKHIWNILNLHQTCTNMMYKHHMELNLMPRVSCSSSSWLFW